MQQQCDAAERGCYAIGHVGVCCTTFSRLANPPYRRHTDAAHPEFIVCLPDTSEKKTRKALEANLMADHSVTLLVAWHCSGMMASLENPHSSMIWQYFEHTGAMSRLQALGFRKFSTCYRRFGTPYKKTNNVVMQLRCQWNVQEMQLHWETSSSDLGQVKTKHGWQSRSFLASPYPRRLVSLWMKVILHALASKYAK